MVVVVVVVVVVPLSVRGSSREIPAVRGVHSCSVALKRTPSIQNSGERAGAKDGELYIPRVSSILNIEYSVSRSRRAAARAEGKNPLRRNEGRPSLRAPDNTLDGFQVFGSEESLRADVLEGISAMFFQWSRVLCRSLRER